METIDVREQYGQLRPKNKKTVAQLLAGHGRAFDEALSQDAVATRKKFASEPEFAVWIAEALVWARYAARDDRFFDPAIRYLTGGNPQDLVAASNYPDRFGDEKLYDSLLAFQNWFNDQRKTLTGLEPVAVKMKAVQDRSLVVAQRLKDAGQLPQVGMWLFPAPFKIMAVAHPEIWTDGALDALLLPAGTQVVRALRMLGGDGIVKVEADLLEGGEGTFGDNITGLWASQLPQQELAKAAVSPALHINSALHLLGHRGPRTSSG